MVDDVEYCRIVEACQNEKLNCSNKFIVSFGELPNVIKRTFGLGNKNLSFLTFLFPNMICLLCSLPR